MKFLSLALVESQEFININVDHVIMMIPHLVWEDEKNYKEYTKIYLSNGDTIIFWETMDCIENEYKELFKQF